MARMQKQSTNATTITTCRSRSLRLGDFDCLARHSVWADLIELSESNCNGPFCRRATVLMQAVMQGHESIARLLLEYGADVNAEGYNHE
jgi:hypothetical protein